MADVTRAGATKLVEGSTGSSFSGAYVASSNGNRALVVLVSAFEPTAANRAIDAISYAGTALTLVATLTDGSAQTWVYILVNPTSGSNTLSVTFHGSITSFTIEAADYFNCKQTGQPDASTSRKDTGVTTTTLSLTTIADRCLVISACDTENGGWAVGTGTTKVLADTSAFTTLGEQSAITTPAASVTPKFNGPSDTVREIILSLAPVISSTVYKSKTLPLLGVG